VTSSSTAGGRGPRRRRGDQRLRASPPARPLLDGRGLRAVGALGARSGDDHAGRRRRAVPARKLPPGDARGRSGFGRHVQEIVGDAGTIADLFAGLGTFTFAFPRAKVYAGEAARDPIMALKAAAARPSAWSSPITATCSAAR
jgi:hypothetical protein